MAQYSEFETVKKGTISYISGMQETLMELDQELGECGEIEGAEERIKDLIEHCKEYHERESNQK